MGVAERARKDTRLESEGAEFLVLGHLLIEGIEAHKAYTRYPGFDVVAFNRSGDRTCRLQVKSRWRSGARGFPIKNFESDFVVFVVLNRAVAEDGSSSSVKPPDIYVIPTPIIEEVVEVSGGWSKAYLRSVTSPEQYLHNWALVRDFLGLSGHR
jgi:hypothetical protein